MFNKTKLDPLVNSSGSHNVDPTAYLIQELDFWSYILYLLAIVLMLVSFFINGLVLTALWTPRTDSLKSSFLIQGIVVSNVLVSLALGTQILPYILLAYGCDPVLTISCYQGFTITAQAMFAISQIYTGVAVVIDRLISVLRPLKYHTTEYSMFLKTLILGGIWGTSLTVCVGFTVIDLVEYSEEDPRHICLVQRDMTTKGLLNTYITPTLIVVGIFSTLFLYLGTLTVVIRQRVRRRQLTDLTIKLRQGNASLAVTFFFVHFTYLLCYMPIIIQYVFFMEDLSVDGIPSININAFAITSDIYQCNTIIDPLVFTWRISSVRNHVWSLLKKGTRGL